MSDAMTAPPERVRAMTRAGYWRDETLTACLNRWARERPDKLAAIDGQRRYTWGVLARLVERVAHGLRAHGLEAGSVVSVQLPNWNEFVVVALAAERLGAVLNPIPPIYRASELRFILGLLESHTVVIPELFRGFDHAAMLATLRAELPQLARVFVARGGPREEDHVIRRRMRFRDLDCTKGRPVRPVPSRRRPRRPHVGPPVPAPRSISPAANSC